MKTLLAAITSLKVTPAELKAQLAQETGDFTIVEVAGIDKNKKGIKRHRKNPTHVGLGQHDKDALKDAIEWAKAHGVVVPDKPDPRLAPETSITLAAAYLGVVDKSLRSGLPKPIPTGRDYRRMLFTAYNFGPKALKDAAKAAASGTKPYAWADIEPFLTKQAREYAPLIEARLQ